jgi:hypothetical protein
MTECLVEITTSVPGRKHKVLRGPEKMLNMCYRNALSRSVFKSSVFKNEVLP